MPPAICNDSEDEEEVLVEDECPSQRSRNSNVSYNAAIDFATDVLSAYQGLDGADDRSSLSTGEISRQIADTTRGFFSSTTDASTTMAAPSCFAKQKLGRRHTDLSGLVATSGKSSKRTMTTYSKSNAKSQRATIASSTEAINAFHNDERASQESLSAAFLQESDTPGPTTDGLPTGTILQGFQEHDPHALFPDTGSTVVNNESSMRRMLEIAREADQQPLNQHNTHISSNGSQTQHTSSFEAWSMSENHTQTPKVASHEESPQKPVAAGAADDASSETVGGLAGNSDANETGNTTDTASAAASTRPQSHVEQGQQPQSMTQDLLTALKQEQQQHGMVAIGDSLNDINKSKPPPRSSPMVIIPPTETPHMKPAKNTQKSSRSRKRKSGEADLDDTTQQRSEPLNSDDRAIGLPKELYKPRLSRRRATAVVEPIDYSAVPEKALKKRRKTIDSDLSGAAAGNELSPSNCLPKSRSTQLDVTRLLATVPGTRSNPGQDEEADMEAAIAASLRDMEESTDAASVMPPAQGVDQATPTDGSSAHQSPQRPVASPLSSPERPKEQTRSSTTASSSSHKPGQTSPMTMLPPVLPASATRKTPRRSQTTIFEDHAAQRSPTLSQQQAIRLAALNDIPHPTQVNKRKRRSIVQQGLEDEDELAKESPTQKPAPGVRGRPPRAESRAAKAKSSQRSPTDSENGNRDRGNESLVDLAPEPAAPEEFGTDGHEDVVKPLSKKSRKSMASARVLQDSDDELELQGEVAAAAPSAQKKKPGRPRKSTAKVLEDSDDEPVLEEDDDDELGIQPKPKKKPGRPSKKQAQPASEINVTQASPMQKTVLEPKDGNANTAVGLTDPGGKGTTPASTMTKHTTPAPDVKPGPGSHSPIKKNAKVIHRVGLGRRQRVQPLLKMIRPDAKARKEDATRVTTVTSVAELERKWSEVPE